MIALSVFAQAHEPLPDFPALCPAAVPLVLPSMASAPEALDNIVPALALYPAVVPLELSLFLNPDHSICGWLTSALPLVLASSVTETLTVPVSTAVAPVLAEAAPVVKKSRKSKATEGTAQGKTPRKRSPKTTATAQ
jgi:hypothetical protein